MSPEEELKTLQAQLAKLEKLIADQETIQVEENQGFVIILFSDDMDRVMSALTLVSGAIALGKPVDVFFSFWALNLIKKKNYPLKGKDIRQKLLSLMLPAGVNKLKLSKMHFLGIGKWMMEGLRKKFGTAGNEELMDIIIKANVKIWACTNTMSIMGISKEEIIDYENLHFCGCANFTRVAFRNKAQLFV